MYINVRVTEKNFDRKNSLARYLIVIFMKRLDISIKFLYINM